MAEYIVRESQIVLKEVSNKNDPISEAVFIIRKLLEDLDLLSLFLLYLVESNRENAIF